MKEYRPMDARDPRHDDDHDDDDAWYRTWEQIARLLQQLGGCGRCEGSGMCPRCAGNGIHFIRTQGMVNCSGCSGDGACVVCHGTGKIHHA